MTGSSQALFTNIGGLTDCFVPSIANGNVVCTEEVPNVPDRRTPSGQSCTVSCLPGYEAATPGSTTIACNPPVNGPQPGLPLSECVAGKMAKH